MDNLPEKMKVLGDETRFRIVSLLLGRQHCVSALARKLGMTEAAVSQHLKVLREAGLVDGQKQGYFMHYRVERSQLMEMASALQCLAESVQEPCLPEGGSCRRRNMGNDRIVPPCC